jgi:hypothetical protein
MHKLVGYISGASVISVLLFAYRWSLVKTDVMVGYNWSFQGANHWPNFDIRNRSGSKTYVLGNMAYTKNHGKQILTFDNKSIWGQELKPGTIVHLPGAPVPQITTLRECTEVEVTVRLQNGREFKGEGPGQLYTGCRKFFFSLRQKIEKSGLPLAN